ncbi:hypothetical protein D3C81_1935200 [compost metagenome]
MLGLDSGLKRDAAGFARYYQQRGERLEQLQAGFVRLRLRIEPTGTGGRLRVEVQDSGRGFDVGQVLAQPAAERRLFGRGLSLVRQLSHNAEWADEGRVARIEFAWEALA